jgi:hypothetical protein
VNTVMNLWVP